MTCHETCHDISLCTRFSHSYGKLPTVPGHLKPDPGYLQQLQRQRPTASAFTGRDGGVEGDVVGVALPATFDYQRVRVELVMVMTIATIMMTLVLTLVTMSGFRKSNQK